MSTKKPDRAGYWWTRPDPGCMWRVVEIAIHEDMTYIEEMGAEGQDFLPACPWWEWEGPIEPPSGPFGVQNGPIYSVKTA